MGCGDTRDQGRWGREVLLEVGHGDVGTPRTRGGGDVRCSWRWDVGTWGHQGAGEVGTRGSHPADEALGVPQPLEGGDVALQDGPPAAPAPAGEELGEVLAAVLLAILLQEPWGTPRGRSGAGVGRRGDRGNAAMGTRRRWGHVGCGHSGEARTETERSGDVGMVVGPAWGW